jgi:hypothetical protein
METMTDLRSFRLIRSHIFGAAGSPCTLEPGRYHVQPYTHGDQLRAGYVIYDEVRSVLGRMTVAEARAAEAARILYWDDRPCARWLRPSLASGRQRHCLQAEDAHLAPGATSNRRATSTGLCGLIVGRRYGTAPLLTGARNWRAGAGGGRSPQRTRLRSPFPDTREDTGNIAQVARLREYDKAETLAVCAG